MFGDILQPTHLLFILVVALIFLGPKRLPEVGRSLGKGIRDFKSAVSGFEEHTNLMAPPPSAPTAAAQPAVPGDVAAQPETPFGVGVQPEVSGPTAAEPTLATAQPLPTVPGPTFAPARQSVTEAPVAVAEVAEPAPSEYAD